MNQQKWESVPVDVSGFQEEDLAMFGGIEELTDYQFVNQKTTTKRTSELKNKKKKKKQKVAPEPQNENVVDPDLNFSAWYTYNLEPSLMESIEELGFEKPTPIQELTIPPALRGNQDILGAAETGSGKTLAFGIPIVNNIIRIKESKKQKGDSLKPLYCVILTPTRELAIQIKNHLRAICKHTDIAIAVIVGGMAPEKQKRLIKKGPDIIVATPGRLWEMIEQEELLVTKIRYLVIDEADRMVEKGHFAELTQILSVINGNAENKKRQTFVFSATLTMTHDAPARLALKRKRIQKIQKEQKLESLVALVGMKDPKIIDITRKTALVETLTECQIMCSVEDKDCYLYYFLQMYPERTIVFCNSIDCLRRLRSILENLNCRPLPLHAQMPQRQRLKNLDRFEATRNGLLLATDVAARGLDIKGIEHVIHFQVPRTAETYVHRSGRTARAQKDGLSLLLIDTEDGVQYKKLCKTLNKDQNLPAFPVDQKLFKAVKDRVSLARAIDKLEHKMEKTFASNHWFVNAAKEMDIDLDDRNIMHDLGDEMEVARKKRQLKVMKKQLSAMISAPISSKACWGRYPTMSGRLIAPQTLEHTKAVNMVQNCKKKKKLF